MMPASSKLGLDNPVSSITIKGNINYNLQWREVMPGLNRVQLIGYLGKDPETRSTPSGSSLCSFSVAVSRRWKKSDGESKEATDWFNVDAWGRLGEICQEYLSKGRLVFIEGRLQTDRVERDNDTRYYTKVVASQMQMLDRKPDEPDTPEQPEGE
jgi:single-strand DNA-binding protein